MTRIRAAILAGIAFAGIMIPCVAPAADEHAVQISQPVISGGTGIVVAQVPYMLWYLPGDDPAFEVGLTVAANTITTGDGTSNRNAANLLGIQLTFPMPPATNRWRRSAPRGVFGDTLRVAIDLSKTEEATQLQDKASITRGFLRKDIVPLTLFSMLENARRGWPRIKHLHVEVVGPDEFKDLAGTYSLERIPDPPKIRLIPSENPKKE